ncbi:cadmium transporter [Priestia koreensis]|uniref:Cadmium transporter n=1 Tax=Priestia koreensis TaxID=284581 RepID=A0A0M0L961_9BACI|nr:cadmium transporter [Priestia koreensis]
MKWEASVVEKQKTKQEFILEGLNCAHCASKIEHSIQQINDVENCIVNFATKTLSFDSPVTSISETSKEAERIVQKIEPHVQVKPKETHAITLTLEGLHCANCANKIEHETAGLEGVREARLNFSTKKLTITGADFAQREDVISRVKQIVKRLEPDVQVVDSEEESSASPTKKTFTPLLARLGIGGVMTAVAAIFSLPFELELSLFICAYVLVGGDVVLRAMRNIWRGQVFDEHFLMVIATIGAFAIGQYPEAVSVMLFYQVGELFQSLAVNRSRASISALMDIKPEYAHVKRNGETKKVSPELVKRGEYIVVKPGEKIPLDGHVVEGQSTLDTSALTGESLPRNVEVGNDVVSGSINLNGLLTIEVTKPYKESTVAKILELVEHASNRKAPTENFITKFARYYTPAIVVGAAALAVLPPLFVTGATFSEWLYRALVFLVISCPCALVISIPLSFFGGIGGASKRGILVKGSNFLEALQQVKYVVFDKTGTLTKGTFTVTDVHTQTVSKDELVAYAAHAEAFSTHPIAGSIRAFYKEKIDGKQIANYQETAGYGTEAMIYGRSVLAGNEKWMEQHEIKCPSIETIGTLVYIAVDGKYAGHLVISDEIKPDAKAAINALKRLGVKKTIMLTGDAKRVAKQVGENVGVDQIYAELLPHQKVEQFEKVDEVKAKREKVIFVGDGINDTPVLARADVGIAMGGLGSDAAIEAADVVIMTDEPSKIAEAIHIAKKTKSIVWQNIVFALGVKGIFLLLGAFGIATMWEAVFSDVGVTLLAVLNAMRVLKSE